jgi:hypothetical protein
MLIQLRSGLVSLDLVRPDYFALLQVRSGYARSDQVRK